MEDGEESGTGVAGAPARGRVQARVMGSDFARRVTFAGYYLIIVLMFVVDLLTVVYWLFVPHRPHDAIQITLTIASAVLVQCLLGHGIYQAGYQRGLMEARQR